MSRVWCLEFYDRLINNWRTSQFGDPDLMTFALAVNCLRRAQAGQEHNFMPRSYRLRNVETDRWIMLPSLR